MNGNDGKRKRSEAEFAKKKPSWMVPVTHGYHVAHDRFFRGESTGESNSDSDPDSVVVQREQIEEVELWFFGVFDARIGEGVTKYLQSHLFDKKPKESQLKKKSKEVMRRAYLGARASIRDAEKVAAEEGKTQKVGSVSALVIGGEKVVIASMGDYRAIVCRYGEAHQVGRKRHNQQGTKRHWATKLIPGMQNFLFPSYVVRVSKTCRAALKKKKRKGGS
ncbi:protein-serine,threonine phosphatase [Sarracenia purpurea var. burkii]